MINRDEAEKDEETKGKDRIQKKLPRQFIGMVFSVLVILFLLFCLLARKGSIELYLSAKSDTMKTDINEDRKQLYAMKEFRWAVDFWAEHADELAAEYNADADAFLVQEDNTKWEDFCRELPEDREEAYRILDSLSGEEQYAVAKECFIKLSGIFGTSYDMQGFESNGCFLPLGNGRYMDLIWIDPDKKLSDDLFFVYDQDMYYDIILSQFDNYVLKDGESSAIDFFSSSFKGGKEVYNSYSGFAPVVYDGEIRAVILLQYNYNDFVAKINDFFGMVTAILILIYSIVFIAFVIRSRKIATKPIASIQSAVREYMTTKDGSSAREKLKNIYSKNEIGVLARDFDKMIEEIDQYVGEIEKNDIKLKALTKEVTEALANAIDAKDKYTRGHSSRVAVYSKKLAKMNGMSDEECDEMSSAPMTER